jgi:hypothetical protein
MRSTVLIIILGSALAVFGDTEVSAQQVSRGPAVLRPICSGARPLNLLSSTRQDILTLSQTEFTGGIAVAFRCGLISLNPAPSNLETKMKLTLIGAAAVAAAAFATPALAQAVISDPGYCAQFYPDANCQNLGPGNPYTDGGYWRNGNAKVPGHARQLAHVYRHHGRAKAND